jgi:hypothetical protein
MSGTSVDLAISTFCAIGFFFSVARDREADPAHHKPTLVRLFASVGAFGLTFLTIYVIGQMLHV